MLNDIVQQSKMWVQNWRFYERNEFRAWFDSLLRANGFGEYVADGLNASHFAKITKKNL